MEQTGFSVIRKARKRTRSESSEVDESVSNESDCSCKEPPSSPERSCYSDGEYHCRRIPINGERSINEILKVVSLQSFSSARLGFTPAAENGFYAKGHGDGSRFDNEEETSNKSAKGCANGSESPHSMDDILEKVTSSRVKKNSDSIKVEKDERYWEKRQRNNASAKRSRDARRVRELETQIRAEYLIDENRKLKNENEVLRDENYSLQRTIESLELQLKNSPK